MSEAELYAHGKVTWHSSDEDSGPDVGLSIGLGDGRMLWVGEVSKSKIAEIEGAVELGGDGGWWIVVYGQNESTVVGKCVSAESARVMFDWLEAALRPKPISMRGFDEETIAEFKRASHEYADHIKHSQQTFDALRQKARRVTKKI